MMFRGKPAWVEERLGRGSRGFCIHDLGVVRVLELSGKSVLLFVSSSSLGLSFPVKLILTTSKLEHVKI